MVPDLTHRHPNSPGFYTMRADSLKQVIDLLDTL
jgi:hypothetical protein